MLSKRLILSVVPMLLLWQAPASAKLPAWGKYYRQGQTAYEAANYKKATSLWSKAARLAEKCRLQEQPRVDILQHLGDSLWRQKKYPESEIAYQTAIKQASVLKLDASEAEAGLKQLHKTYRSIDLAQVSAKTPLLLKHSGAQNISILKTEAGHKITLKLKNKLTHKVESMPQEAGVDTKVQPPLESTTDQYKLKQFKLEKKVSFELLRDGNGKIELANIQGLSLNVGMWVRLLQTAVKLNGDNQPVAEITAGKMGVSKTVNFNIPQLVYDRLNHAADYVDSPEKLMPD